MVLRKLLWRKTAILVIVDPSIVGTSRPVLRRFLARACRAAGLGGRVVVLITTSSELRTLNRRFRRKNQPTDVLSFPAPGGGGNDLEGDIAVSAEIAAANAIGLGHSLTDELKLLILHGVLHLAGYDHETDNGEMARREASLRRELKLPQTLIQRETKPAKPLAKARSKRRTAAGTIASRTSPWPIKGTPPLAAASARRQE